MTRAQYNQEDGPGGYAHVRMGEPYATLTVREPAADLPAAA